MSVPNFPHLLPVERFLWARFLVRYGAQWDAFEYDVRLGQGRPIDPSWPDYIQDMARHLSKKRVDAVGYKGGQPTIFEVRPVATRAVVGALQLYEFLWREEHPQGPAPALAAVVDRIDPDTLRFFQASGDQVFVLGEPATV